MINITTAPKNCKIVLLIKVSGAMASDSKQINITTRQINLNFLKSL
ncbi:hypothetical protein HME9304_03329 [Flagellimonas maritima]|uniref:Uncharacterized protein n=1 Tax=Flagellimonas maritima TaxID=1383885 RepID=A0A2Z4LX53_9FLAO|nr:hypothetical protein HME9304_03329 [Allomuricauda aurantiaca]